MERRKWLPKSDFLFKKLKSLTSDLSLLCTEGIAGVTRHSTLQKMYIFLAEKSCGSYILHFAGGSHVYAIPNIYLLLDLLDREIKRVHCCPWFCKNVIFYLVRHLKIICKNVRIRWHFFTRLGNVDILFYLWLAKFILFTPLIESGCCFRVSETGTSLDVYTES